jgi:nicotinamide phosphoribosyltransferase
MEFFNKNLAVSTDSYKASHACKSQNEHVKTVGQFPEGTTHTSYYIEARTEDEELVAAGMNFVAKVLEQGITLVKVNRANLIYRAHFGREIFNYDAWVRIATEFGGKLPIDMWAVPEGTIIPSKTAIAVIENTHPDYPWLPGNLETFALRGVWYPTSVTTKSYRCLKVLKKYMDMTSDLKGEAYTTTLKTRLHDFGARGASSEESAAIGGLAHLYNFIGTDTVEALVLAQDLYNVACAGFSIPAREHSTTISYEDEDDAYRNSIELYGEGYYSCVMDSTDYEAAVERVCLTMKDDIIAKGGTFVFRPDSGSMIDNIMFTLNILGKYFGYTRNSKGYKVLHPSVRIIQGDDINSADDIERVLSWMETHRWAAENIAFGMGGGLLQKVNRDTHKFAMKLSAIKVNGEWRGVRKCPKGAEWKASKKGRLRTIRRHDGKLETVDILTNDTFEGSLEMFKFIQDGKLGYTDTLENIRKCIDNSL